MGLTCMSTAPSPQFVQGLAGIQGLRGLLILTSNMVNVLVRENLPCHIPFVAPILLPEGLSGYKEELKYTDTPGARSVQNQTVREIEICIVCDGSPDPWWRSSG